MSFKTLVVISVFASCAFSATRRPFEHNGPLTPRSAQTPDTGHSFGENCESTIKTDIRSEGPIHGARYVEWQKNGKKGQDPEPMDEEDLPVRKKSGKIQVDRPRPESLQTPRKNHNAFGFQI